MKNLGIRIADCEGTGKLARFVSSVPKSAIRNPKFSYASFNRSLVWLGQEWRLPRYHRPHGDGEFDHPGPERNRYPAGGIPGGTGRPQFRWGHTGWNPWLLS